MKIKQITTTEVDVEIQFPIFRKTNYSHTKWFGYKNSITVYYSAIDFSNFVDIKEEDYLREECSELEFKEAFLKVYNTFKEMAGITNEHPELSVSEG